MILNTGIPDVYTSVNETANFDITETGQQILIKDKHVFCVDCIFGEFIHWKCEKSTCNMRALTKGEQLVKIKDAVKHTHKPPTKNEYKKIVNLLI